MNAGRPLNFYRFAGSKKEPGVQFAHVVVGLLGARLTWLRKLNIEKTLAIKQNLTPAQNGNRLAFFSNLIER